LKGPGPANVAEVANLKLRGVETPVVEDVEVTYVEPPADETARTEFFSFVFNVWLKEKLERKEFIPSPSIRLVEGGLGAVNKGIDEWRGGVSGEKIVLELP
jgi:hypothetical protein